MFTGSRSHCGDRNFFHVCENRLIIEPLGNHTGPYQRALHMFQADNFHFFRRQPDFETAKVILNDAEEAFMEFMQKFRKMVLTPVSGSQGEVISRHARLKFDRFGWSQTYCGQLWAGKTLGTSPELVMSLDKFQKAKVQCPDCAAALISQEG